MPSALHFPPFELRPAARTLLRDGRPLRLGARAFDTLLALVEAAGELVTKDQLLDRAWHGLVVEEANVHVQVSLLRKLLGADAIATVPGLGYRFALPVGVTGSALAVPHNLPAERTAFVGREVALAAARRHLGATRLLTFVGIGGTGKTRLARRLAEQVMADYPDGVWWVDLAAIDDSGRVLQTVAQAVRCRIGDEVSLDKALADHLRARHVLLVLDNCEHVLEEVASRVDELLSAAPGLRVLATSREALAVPGETAVPVRPMALPAPGSERGADELCESERLFLQSALHALPGFIADASNAADIAAICRELDGLPLAIELAAAQMQVVAPAQLLAMLRERFRVLGGPRRALARQQTLRTVIQWSWEHLRPVEQRVLAALAVCAGSCTLETLRDLLSQADDDDLSGAILLGGLSRLSDLSLIDVAHVDRVARYRLLETVKQFAIEKVGDSGGTQVLRDRHLDHFLERSARWAAGFRGPSQAAVLQEVDSDSENATRALDWAVASGRWLEAAELADHLFLWWTARTGAALALEAIEGVLEVVPPDTAEPRVAVLLCHASSVAMRRNQLPRARALAQRSVEVAKRSADRTAVLDATIMKARLDAREGLFKSALDELLPVVEEARQRGMDRVLGDALNILGQVQSDLEDFAAATRSLTESVLLSQRLGHHYDVAVDCLCLASLALELEDAPQARRWMREAAASRDAADHRYVDQMWLDLAAWLAAVEGDWARAIAAFRVANRWAESLQHGRSNHWQQLSKRCLERARAAVGDAAWQTAWQAGADVPLGVAIEEADGWLIGVAAAEPAVMATETHARPSGTSGQEDRTGNDPAEI